MQDFYRKALAGLVFLIVASSLIAYFCISRSYLEDSLLPIEDSKLAWELDTRVDDSPTGPRSTIRSRFQNSKFSIDFRLREGEGRTAAAAMLFRDKAGNMRLADLSRYSTISFVARCTPSNSITLSIPTFIKSVSQKDYLLSYRTVYSFFSCGDAPSRIELDLTRMTTAGWWFDMFKVDLANQDYKLDGVAKIEFGSSFRSPVGVDSHFEIEDITLNGRDYRYLQGLAAYLLLAVGGYVLWFVWAYSRALKEHLKQKMQRDLPLVAYQQLSIEPHRDKEKGAILRAMATRYADPDLDLDALVAETGANRNKVNDILKAELGFTFSTYLNKLRLTEAARLLSEQDTATIGEIAYSVGYKNVTYFNRLFKEEYNCTPKAFREIYKKQVQS